MNKRCLNVERSVKKVKYTDRGDNNKEEKFENKMAIVKQDHGDTKTKGVKRDVCNKIDSRTDDIDTAPMKIKNIAPEDKKCHESVKNHKKSIAITLDSLITRVAKANEGIVETKRDVLIQPNSKMRSEEPLTSTACKANKDTEKQAPTKPLIKTTISKNDSTKIFKSITFVEHKKPTRLLVNIPSEVVKRKTKKDAPKQKNQDEKMVNRKSVKTRRETDSYHRVNTKGTIDVSPPTEVAKWVPASINKHTKPYYEAWVSTTLAAISRDRKNRIIVEKPKSQSEMSEPIYENFKDEKFIGRIRINHR